MKHFLLMFAAVCLAACGGGGGGGTPPERNARLASLVLNSAELVPGFSSNVFDYTAEVANTTTSVTVIPTTEVDTSTVTVNGDPVASGTESAPIDLVEGENTVLTTVTSEDGTQLTYTVIVTRLPPPSSNATLADLTLTLTDLDQIFDPTLTSYTASTGHLGNSTFVIATPEDDGATITVNGIPAPAGLPSSPVPLAVGSSDLVVEVTAEDKINTASYTVTVTRADLASLGQEAYVKASNTNAEDAFGFGSFRIDQVTGPIDLVGAAVDASGDTLLIGAPGEQSRATGINGNQADNTLADAGAAYLLDRQGGSWTQTAYVKASNTDQRDRFGVATTLSGNIAAVGATGEQSLSAGVGGDQTDNSGRDVGAVYVFERADATSPWAQAAYVKASNADTDDQFGGALDLTGPLLVVGARFENSAATGINGNQTDESRADAGAAYVYTRSNGGSWLPAAYVKASNTDAGDEFGRAVAVTRTDLVIGAWLEDSSATGINGRENDRGAADSGAAYLFSHEAGSNLAQSAYVKASNTDADDRFGSSVALSGSLLAVGATGEDSAASGINGDESDNSLVDAGAVYVFEKAGDGTWSQIAYVKASNPGLEDFFGAAVALRGNLLIVGAPGEDSAARGINGDQNNELATDAGAVYVYERDAAGTFTQIAYVKASNADQDDIFGAAVALAGDSLYAGAAGEQSASTGINGNEADNSVRDAGASYVVR